MDHPIVEEIREVIAMETPLIKCAYRFTCMASWKKIVRLRNERGDARSNADTDSHQTAFSDS